MTPKFMSDAEGDTPPCDIMWDAEEAKRWDEYKEKKYNGKSKAKKAIYIFWDENPEQQPLWYRWKKYFSKLFKKKQVAKPLVFHGSSTLNYSRANTDSSQSM